MRRRQLIFGILFLATALAGVYLLVSDYIAQLKARVPLETVAAAVVELRDSGKSLIGKCPFHADSTPSFNVYKGENKFFCFGCEAKGDTLDFVEKFYNLSKQDAIAKLKEFAGQPDAAWSRSAQVFQPATEQKQRTYRTFTLAEWQGAVDRLWSDAAKDGRAFLSKRGIGEETARRLRLGYIPYGTRLAGSTGQHDKPEDHERLEKIRHSAWIGIPYIQGDAVVSVKWRAAGDVEKRDRFRYEAGMQTSGLFNTDTIDPLDELYLTEGEFDAITLEQAGFRAVSIRSASQSAQKLAPQIKDMLIRAERIYLAGDNEKSGVGLQAMERLLKDLGEKAHLILWPRADNEEKKDANSFFVTDCKGDAPLFRKRVMELSAESRRPTSPHFRSVIEIISRLRHETKPVDDPRRLRWPWPEIDKMALVIPGDIFIITASTPGSGKSPLMQQIVNHNVLHPEFKKTAVVYTPDLKPTRHARMIVSQLSKSNRSELKPTDYDLATQILSEGALYLGFDPEISTMNAAIDLLEQAIRRLGADIAVIDTFHYILRGGKDSNRVQMAEDGMARLNGIAEKYGVMIGLVCQPRTQPADGRTRSMTRVMEIEDIKYASAIREDAVAIGILHRQKTGSMSDDPKKQNFSSESEFHMKKSREQGGGPQFANLFFEGSHATFYEMTAREPGDEPMEPVWES
jgi:hypothetical protein